MSELVYKATLKTSEEVVVAKSINEFIDSLNELTKDGREVLCIGARVCLASTETSIDEKH